MTGAQLFGDLDSVSTGEVLAGLIGLAVTGRVVLAWLPAGRYGGHAVAELPRTASVSLLLGLAVATLVARWAEYDGSYTRAVYWRPALGLAVAAAAALRLATLPGAMVPRHEPAREAPGRAARLAGLALVSVFALQLVRVIAAPQHQPIDPLAYEHPLLLGHANHGLPRPGALPLAAWCFLAALFVLVEDALAVARRAPLERRLLLLAAALCAWRALPMRNGAALAVRLGADAWSAGWMLLACGSCATSFAWLRRADRRALWVALISLAGAACWRGSFALAYAPLALALVLTSPARTRRGVAIATATIALLSWPCWSLRTLDGPLMAPDELSFGWLSLLFVALLAASLGLRGRRWRPRHERGCIDEPARELALVVAFLLAGPLFVLALGFGLPALVPRTQLAEPLAWLGIGLVALRAERTRA